ncbi:hypothetical protein RI129_003080 [Pyrocoelia pectoralis]|uniref:OTU domain-containing protein n=1 Tax=Pyrocoelia pectoralis TaxID=417401 RepID=A0AAN7ZUK0_9COLE
MVEYLNIDGELIRQLVVPIVGDGACLFRAISYLIYGTQEMSIEVRKSIVRYVSDNWDNYSVISHDRNGDNYSTSAEYIAEMLQPSTYGSLCELLAAGQIFNFVFEVYENGVFYTTSGIEGRPIKRLKFSTVRS